MRVGTNFWGHILKEKNIPGFGDDDDDDDDYVSWLQVKKKRIKS